MTAIAPALPLHLENKKTFITAFLAITLVLYVFALGVMIRITDFKHPSSALFTILVLSGLVLYLISTLTRTIRRKARLDMDEQGVRVTTNGQVRLYEWADLFDAQQVIIGHGRVGPLYAVQLRRKGQLPIADNRTDLIQDDFGLGHDQIIAAIQAGIHRWGNGPAVASA